MSKKMTTTTLPKEKQALIDEVKSRGHNVFMTSMAGGNYIYRNINRLEYRGIQDQVLNKSLERAKVLQAKAEKEGLPADADLESGDRSREDGEEILLMLALMEPAIESSADIGQFPAGVVTKLADMIMEASGFVPGQPEVTQL